jgi:FMN phosphatase YigB (HAD superfamily)
VQWELEDFIGPNDRFNVINLGSPTQISRRSGLIPAIALDLDKTVYTNSPAMDAAEGEALKNIIPFNDAKKQGIVNIGEEMEFAAKRGFWQDWERLAITDIEPNPEMIKFLKRLQGSGISLNAMTARSARVQEQTLGLLEKMGIVPNEVFFRPDSLIGEDTPAAAMKVNWMKQTSNRYNYVSMFDDSGSNVKAALKFGVPSILQPDAKGVDPDFLEGALKRGLNTMDDLTTKGEITSQQTQRGVSNLNNLIETAEFSRPTTKAGSRTAETFVNIAKSKAVAQSVIKGVL